MLLGPKDSSCIFKGSIESFSGAEQSFRQQVLRGRICRGLMPVSLRVPVSGGACTGHMCNFGDIPSGQINKSVLTLVMKALQRRDSEVGRCLGGG